MEIVNIKISDLTLYENNAKIHNPGQIQKIKNSIKEFGMNDPLGVWGDTNQIVEGHGRYYACKELNYTEIPCIRLDHLTDEQRRAYCIAHNATNLLTGLDKDILQIEMDTLDGYNFEDLGVPEGLINMELDNAGFSEQGFKLKYPITVIFDEDEWQAFEDYKKSIKMNNDAKAFRKLLGL